MLHPSKLSDEISPLQLRSNVTQACLNSGINSAMCSVTSWSWLGWRLIQCYSRERNRTVDTEHGLFYGILELYLQRVKAWQSRAGKVTVHLQSEQLTLKIPDYNHQTSAWVCKLHYKGRGVRNSRGDAEWGARKNSVREGSQGEGRFQNHLEWMSALCSGRHLPAPPPYFPRSLSLLPSAERERYPQ